MARPPLTPQSAQITTASVQIKALTVNGKQVTLAVFRQLYDEPLYDTETWEANGQAWCRVNYHADRCDKEPQHEHVVWQKGDELRRTRINKPAGGLNAVPWFEVDGDDEEIAICLAADGIAGAQIFNVIGTTVGGTGRRAKTIPEPAVDVSAIIDQTRYSCRLFLDSHDTANLVSRRETGKHWLGTRHVKHHPTTEHCEQAAAHLLERLQLHTRWRRQADQVWKDIQTLDQVFIAL